MTSDTLGNLSSHIASLNFLQGDVSDLKKRMTQIEELEQKVEDLERKNSSLIEPADGDLTEGKSRRAATLPELAAASERSLLHDIQSHFVCESCGSTHLVAALVKCTECNQTRPGLVGAQRRSRSANEQNPLSPGRAEPLGLDRLERYPGRKCKLGGGFYESIRATHKHFRVRRLKERQCVVD